MFEGILGIKKATFGLDIGHKTLKIVQVKGEGNKANLLSYSEVEIPENILTKDGIKEKQKLGASIVQAIKTAKPHPVTARIVSSALPESIVFTKIAVFPNMKEKELAKNIPAKATEFFPVPIEEIYLDWQVIGTNTQKNSIEAIIVAAPKILVENLAEIIKATGLELGGLETKPIAVCRALVAEHDKYAYLILDIGAKGSGLTCYDDMTIKMTSTIAVGGDELAKNFDSASKTLGAEINHLIKYYQNRLGQTDVFAKIILAGGGANTPRICEALQEITKIRTEIGVPQINLKSYNPKFVTALGLAMKKI